VQANPFYLLFASPPTWGGLCLRWALAAGLIFSTFFDPAPLFAGLPVASDPGSATHYQFMRDVGCAIAAGFLFLGLLTRIVSLLLAAALLVAMVLEMQILAGPIATQIVLMGAALGLTFSGAGIFSVDRKISRFLLPNVG
jgi:uncharacterized membrane protein YphA (DoxX/SURF4 family)